MESGLVLPTEFEVRQEGDSRLLLGIFPYSVQATVSDRRRVRKEMFEPYALGFAIRDLSRNIHLLMGHTYNRPPAVRAATGSNTKTTLKIKDTEKAVEF